MPLIIGHGLCIIIVYSRSVLCLMIGRTAVLCRNTQCSRRRRRLCFALLRCLSDRLCPSLVYRGNVIPVLGQRPSGGIRRHIGNSFRDIFRFRICDTRCIGFGHLLRQAGYTLDLPKRLVGIKRYITDFTDLICEINNISILIFKNDGIFIHLTHGKITLACIIGLKRDISGSAYWNRFIFCTVFIKPTEEYIIFESRIIQIRIALADCIFLLFFRRCTIDRSLIQIICNIILYFGYMRVQHFIFISRCRYFLNLSGTGIWSVIPPDKIIAKVTEVFSDIRGIKNQTLSGNIRTNKLDLINVQGLKKIRICKII